MISPGITIVLTFFSSRLTGARRRSTASSASRSSASFRDPVCRCRSTNDKTCCPGRQGSCRHLGLHRSRIPTEVLNKRRDVEARRAVGVGQIAVCLKGEIDGKAAYQLCTRGADGRGDARRDGALSAGGHPATGKLRDPGPCPGLLLVLCQFMARHLPQWHPRPRHQGAVPTLCFAFCEIG